MKVLTEVIFIRHGKTEGNKRGAYIGSTDESLSEEGTNEVLQQKKTYQSFAIDRVYSSPMVRCLQTTKLLFNNMKPSLIDDFRECDFGQFEGLNYLDLNGNVDYQAFIDSNGTIAFPDGEHPDAFKKRCQQAFLKLMQEREKSKETLAFVVHGGTIMAIFEAFARPKKTYYDWQVKNVEGFHAIWTDEHTLIDIETLP